MSDPADLKPFPVFTTDEEAEQVVEDADLSAYDFSRFKPAHFEFEKKGERVNMRLPQSLLSAVKSGASREGIPYQCFIRQALERPVSQPKKPPRRP